MRLQTLAPLGCLHTARLARDKELPPDLFLHSKVDRLHCRLHLWDWPTGRFRHASPGPPLRPAGTPPQSQTRGGTSDSGPWPLAERLQRGPCKGKKDGGRRTQTLRIAWLRPRRPNPTPASHARRCKTHMTSPTDPTCWHKASLVRRSRSTSAPWLKTEPKNSTHGRSCSQSCSASAGQRRVVHTAPANRSRRSRVWSGGSLPLPSTARRYVKNQHPPRVPVPVLACAWGRLGHGTGAAASGMLEIPIGSRTENRRTHTSCES